MIFEFKCKKCNNVFEQNATSNDAYWTCPRCGGYAKRMFSATPNIFIPAYFHTSRSDIFSDTEWQDLKKDPNVERAK